MLPAASEFITHHQQWAAVLLAGAMFLSFFVAIGGFVPAIPLMLMAGGLAATGVVDPVAMVIAATIGATAGNAVSYAIGRRLGPLAVRHRRLRPHRRKLARVRLLCRRYGVFVIFVCRFVGPLRGWVPLAVGMLGMRQLQFQLASAASAMLWVGVTFTPGYLATKGLI